MIQQSFTGTGRVPMTRPLVSLRVDASVKEELTQRAKQLGIPLSEYVETLVLKGIQAVKNEQPPKSDLTDTSVETLKTIMADLVEETKQLQAEQTVKPETDSDLLDLEEDTFRMLKNIKAYRQQAGNPINYKKYLLNELYDDFSWDSNCKQKNGFSLNEIKQAFYE